MSVCVSALSDDPVRAYQSLSSLTLAPVTGKSSTYKGEASEGATKELTAEARDDRDSVDATGTLQDPLAYSYTHTGARALHSQLPHASLPPTPRSAPFISLSCVLVNRHTHTHTHTHTHARTHARTCPIGSITAAPPGRPFLHGSVVLRDAKPTGEFAAFYAAWAGIVATGILAILQPATVNWTFVPVVHMCVAGCVWLDVDVPMNTDMGVRM